MKVIIKCANIKLWDILGCFHYILNAPRISSVASLDLILSKKGITKALIRLRGCAGLLAPLLFANPKDRFSHVEAHMICGLWPEIL